MKNIFIILLLTVWVIRTSAQGTLQITTDAGIKTTGNAFIVLNNMNVVNNGSFIQSVGDGTTKLTGNINTTISGTGTTTLDQMEVAIDNGFNNTLSTLVSLKNVVTVNSGQLVSNGLLTLKSDALNTARVAPIISPIDPAIAGDVIIERFILARRAWRFLAAPVNSSGAPTINASWQEGVTTSDPNPGFGTHITGGSTINGFDQNTSNSSSLKIYNNSGGTIDQNNWVGIGTTLTPITGQQGYMLFVRGSRANDLSQGSFASSDNTTLRIAGGLRSGDQTISVDATGYTVVGNPYASPMNLNNLAKANGSTNIADNYYVWDPKMAGTFGAGGYVNILWNPGTSSYDITPTPVSDVSQYIQSGEAFFATSTGNAGNIVIKETDKSGSGSDNVFRVISGSDQKIRTNLYAVKADGTTSILDGTLSGYSNVFSDAIDKYDAVKLTNFGENIAIVREGKTFIVERRKAIGENINLKIWQMNRQEYQLEVITENVDPNVTAFLKDNYLKVSTPLIVSGPTKVNFAVTSDVASAAENRFSIIFGKPATVRSNLSIYPNPVTNGIINVRFDEMPQGNYKVRVVNSLGQTILTHQIYHAQGSAVETLKINGKGVYHIEIVKPDNSKVSTKLIAN